MKKLLIVLVPFVLLIVGYVLASIGIVNVPGISPQKFGKPVLATDSIVGSVLWTLGDPVQRLSVDLAAAKKKLANITPPKTADKKPTTDLEKGRQELAQLWNGLDADKLGSITLEWQPTALAPILIKMDQDQVSALLSALDPKRADAISKAIQVQASKPPVQKPSADGTQAS